MASVDELSDSFTITGENVINNPKNYKIREKTTQIDCIISFQI